MIEYTYNGRGRLWDAYFEMDYGRDYPKKGYKGFRTFLEDVSGADAVHGTIIEGFVLRFQDEKQYTWFLLKWC